jgi:transposase-like protein
MVIITKATPSQVTKIACPFCKEQVKRVGLEKNSIVKGLTFKCKRCGMLWAVNTNE